MPRGAPAVTAQAGGAPRRQHRQTLTRARPLRRRAARIARPARVRMRSRNPCVFARWRLFGWNVRLLTGDSRYTGRLGERGHSPARRAGFRTWLTEPGRWPGQEKGMRARHLRSNRSGTPAADRACPPPLRFAASPPPPRRWASPPRRHLSATAESPRRHPRSGRLTARGPAGTLRNTCRLPNEYRIRPLGCGQAILAGGTRDQVIAEFEIFTTNGVAAAPTCTCTTCG
jgi:hypothetical protein